CTTGSGVPCSEIPSVNVLYTDVWTDPAQATQGAPITLSYNDLDAADGEVIPTNSACASAWAANCRIIINYPKHIQPIWDLATRKDAKGNAVTCTQGGCHTTTDAMGATQAPAGQLNLTNAASNDEP